jgi:hypothetical protein
MPTNTKVERLYKKLKAEGHSVESAIRIAQSATGLSLATGKPPKHPTKKSTPVHDTTKFSRRKNTKPS